MRQIPAYIDTCWLELAFGWLSRAVDVVVVVVLAETNAPADKTFVISRGADTAQHGLGPFMSILHVLLHVNIANNNNNKNN